MQELNQNEVNMVGGGEVVQVERGPIASALDAVGDWFSNLLK